MTAGKPGVSHQSPMVVQGWMHLKTQTPNSQACSAVIHHLLWEVSMASASYDLRAQHVAHLSGLQLLNSCSGRLRLMQFRHDPLRAIASGCLPLSCPSWLEHVSDSEACCPVSCLPQPQDSGNCCRVWTMGLIEMWAPRNRLIKTSVHVPCCPQLSLQPASMARSMLWQVWP